MPDRHREQAMARLQEYYASTVVPKLKQQLGIDNVMELPRITKVTLNMGVGETITDHASHQPGRDVDLYALDHPVNALPGAFLCEGSRPSDLRFSRLTPPADATGSYARGGALLTAAERDALLQRYATMLAYGFASWSRVEAFVWHGVGAIADQALAIATAAFDSGWKSTWGPSPSAREAITSAWNERSRKLVGQGSGPYPRSDGTGWPLHQDHLHVRLTPTV